MLFSIIALFCCGQKIEVQSSLPPITFLEASGDTVVAVDSKHQVWQIRPFVRRLSTSLPSEIPGPFRFAFRWGSLYAVSKSTGQVLVRDKGLSSWRKLTALNHFVSRILINDHFLFAVGMKKSVKVLDAINLSSAAIASRKIIGLPIVSPHSVAYLNSKGTIEMSRGSKFQPKVLIPKYPVENYIELPLIYPEIGAFDSSSALLTKQLVSQRIFRNGKVNDLDSRVFRAARSGDQSQEIDGTWWFVSQKKGRSFMSILDNSDSSVLDIRTLPTGRLIDQRFFRTEQGDIIYLWWDGFLKPKQMRSYLLTKRRGKVQLIREKVFACEPDSSFAVTVSSGRIWLYDDGVTSVAY